MDLYLRKNNLRFLEFVIDHELILIADDYLRNELLNVISRRKFSSVFTAQNLIDAMEFFDSLTTFIITKKEFFGSPDVKDDFLFDLAVQSKTKIIVSGDKKLIDFKNEKVTVISFKEFLEKFKN